LKKNLARRDKVVFISLVDILLQLTFVLLIVILFVYKEHDSLIVKYETLRKSTADASQCIADKNKCEQELSDIKKQYLQACIPLSKTAAAPSVKFTAYSTRAVIFQGFTGDYFKYIESKNDLTREKKAKNIKPGLTVELSDIEGTFGFIREPDCFHEFSVSPIASINSVESGQVWGKIASTFRKLAD